ncbi:MAG: TonB-dependent hemoglobin/transferrin/lactoferrin family receptor [Pseudomonadota bacterium]
MRGAKGIFFTVVATGPAFAESPVLLDEVLVENASRAERAVIDTPVGATVLPREDLERRDADTFEELIGDAPGVLIEGGPRGAAQEPNIRGFSDEQIVLRVDGGRVNFNQAHRGRFFLDPDIVQQVEIIRGGGSTVQGSGALGGVIAFETRDAYDLLEEGQTFGARLRTSFETNGDAFGQTATAYGALDGFDVLGFAAYRDIGDDLDDGSGVDIRASEIDVINGLGKVGFQIGEAGRVEAILSYYTDDGITPSVLDNVATDGNIVDRDTEVFTGRLGFDYAPVGSDMLDLSALVYFNTLEITEDRISDARADTTSFDTFGLELTNRSEIDIGMPLNLVYGVEFLRDEQSGERNGGDRLQFPDASINTYSAFIEADLEVLPGLSILPGVRFDRFELNSATQPDRSESEFSPRVGISYRPTDNLQIYGNYARAFRAPSLTELYSDDVHFAAQGFQLDPTTTFSGINTFVPTPNLQAESSDQFEFGIRFSDRDVFQKGDALSVSVGGYYANVDNFIDTSVQFIDFSTAQFDPILNQLVVGGTTTSVNVDAELYGAELEARYDVGLWWASLAGSLPRGTGDTGERLGSIPQDRITLGLGLRPIEGVEIGGRATVASARSSGGVDTDAYEVVDIFASYSPTSGPLAGVTLRAGIDNLFDETYNLHPNALNQPGRTFKLVGAIKF